MSPRSLQILAVALGILGVLLGTLGTITAYNAKQSVRSDSELAADIQQNFATEQAKQDALEKQQASDAEKMVASLSSSKKSLIGKITANTRAIRIHRRQLRRLRAQANVLASRDRGLADELTTVEADFESKVKGVNARVDRTNRRINRQQNEISRLRGFVSP